MVGYKDTFDVAKKLLQLHRKNNNNCPMVSFIHNGREVTIWLGHSFKTKRATSFLNLKLQVVRNRATQDTFLKAQGTFFLSFLCTLFLHIFDS